MAEQNLVVQITAVNEASRAFQEVQRDVIQAGAAAQKSFGAATPNIETFGRSLREGTQTVRAMTGALLSEMNPALGAFTMTLSLAAREAARMPVALGAVTVGIAAAGAALVPYVRQLQEAEQFQAKFSFAVRGSDFSALRAQLDQQIEAMQTWRQRSAAVQQEFTGLGSEISRLTAILQNYFSPTVDQNIQRILMLKDALAALAPGLTAAQIAGIGAATARVRADAPGVTAEEQAAQTQTAFRLERVRLQQEAANQLQGLQPEFRAILAPGISEQLGAAILLSVEQERAALGKLQELVKLRRQFAPLGGIPTPGEEEAMLLPPRLTLAELEAIQERTGQLRMRRLPAAPTVIGVTEEEAVLMPPRLGARERQELLAPFQDRTLQAEREQLGILQQMPGLRQQERVELDLQLIGLERRARLEEGTLTAAAESNLLRKEQILAMQEARRRVQPDRVRIFRRTDRRPVRAAPPIPSRLSPRGDEVGPR